MMEKDCPKIVQMAIQSEEAPACLIRPNLDLVIVPTRNKEGLCFVEVDTPNWAIVLLKPVNQGAHAIIPQLDSRGV
jgi:hypothetical protein